MAEIASAFVSLLPSARGFGRKLEGQIGSDVDKAGKSTGKRFGVGMAAAAIGALGGVAAIGSFLKGSIDEAREAQKVGAQTANVIKSTGGAAKVSAKQVGDLATAISLKTGVDDEAIQSGENLLLTFTNVKNEVGKGNDVFSRATGLIADMGAALGQDTKASAIQLGKALNDPVKGMTALSRVGVSFTAQQKATNKALVEGGDANALMALGLVNSTTEFNAAIKSQGGNVKKAVDLLTKDLTPAQVKYYNHLTEGGHVVEAQKTILKELNKEFGGSAAATATAGDKFKVAFGNLKESVGTALLPVVDQVLNGMTKLATSLSANIGPAVEGVGKIVRRVRGAFGLLFGGSDVRDSAGGFAEVLDNVLGNTGKLIQPLTAAGIAVRKFVSTFKATGVPAIKAFAAAFVANLLPSLKTAANTFKTVVLPAIATLVGYVASKLIPIFAQVASIFVTRVLPGVAAVARFFYGTLYPAVVAIATSVAQSLKPVFDQLVATIQGSVLPTLSKILARFRQWWPTIKQVAVVLVGLIGWFIKFNAAVLGKVLPPLIKFVGVMLSRFIPSFLDAIEWIAKAIGFVIKFGAAIVNAVKFAVKFQVGVDRAIAKVLGIVIGLPGKVVSALGDLGKTLYNAGRKLIGGLVDGIKSKVKDVTGAVKSVAGKIKGFFPGSPVREGPLKSWNRGGAGMRLVGMLADGLGNTGPVDSAARGLASRVQVAAPRLEPSVLGATHAGAGGSEIRGVLSLDRDGVATLHGVGRAAVREGRAQREAVDRNRAMGGESFR